MSTPSSLCVNWRNSNEWQDISIFYGRAIHFKDTGLTENILNFSSLKCVFFFFMAPELNIWHNYDLIFDHCHHGNNPQQLSFPCVAKAWQLPSTVSVSLSVSCNSWKNSFPHMVLSRFSGKMFSLCFLYACLLCSLFSSKSTCLFFYIVCFVFFWFFSSTFFNQPTFPSFLCFLFSSSFSLSFHVDWTSFVLLLYICIDSTIKIDFPIQLSFSSSSPRFFPSLRFVSFVLSSFLPLLLLVTFSSHVYNSSFHIFLPLLPLLFPLFPFPSTLHSSSSSPPSLHPWNFSFPPSWQLLLQLVLSVPCVSYLSTAHVWTILTLLL